MHRRERNLEKELVQELTISWKVAHKLVLESKEALGEHANPDQILEHSKRKHLGTEEPVVAKEEEPVAEEEQQQEQKQQQQQVEEEKKVEEEPEPKVEEKLAETTPSTGLLCGCV